MQIVQTQNTISKLSTLSGCDYPGYSFIWNVFLCMGCFGICRVLVQGPTTRYMEIHGNSEQISAVLEIFSEQWA